MMNYEEARYFFYHKIKSPAAEKMLWILADDNVVEGLNLIKELTACDDDTAKLLWADLKSDFGTKETNCIIETKERYKTEKSPYEIEQAALEFKYRNNAECPYCHSKNTKKISTLSKAGSVALFGVFAIGKTSKQWHCKNCGSDF